MKLFCLAACRILFCLATKTFSVFFFFKWKTSRLVFLTGWKHRLSSTVSLSSWWMHLWVLSSVLRKLWVIIIWIIGLISSTVVPRSWKMSKCDKILIWENLQKYFWFLNIERAVTVNVSVGAGVLRQWQQSPIHRNSGFVGEICR